MAGSKDSTSQRDEASVRSKEPGDRNESESKQQISEKTSESKRTLEESIEESAPPESPPPKKPDRKSKSSRRAAKRNNQNLFCVIGIVALVLVVLAIIGGIIIYFVVFRSPADQTDPHKKDDDTIRRENQTRAEFPYPHPVEPVEPGSSTPALGPTFDENDFGGSLPDFTPSISDTWQIPTHNYWPTLYDLDLNVYLPGYKTEIPKEKEFKIEGRVQIKIEVNETVQTLELHVKDLALDLAALLPATATKHEDVRRMNFAINETLERVAFGDGKPIEPGVYYLKVTYSGNIQTQMAGMYRSMYYEQDGTQFYIATTQMEPTSARLMVPCFDEPRFKAVWSIAVQHPLGTQVTSNAVAWLTQTDIRHEQLTYALTAFEDTPPLSTYILAIVVHNFANITRQTARGVNITVYARREKIELCNLALGTAMNVLPYFEKMLNRKYELKKLDLFGIPDFAAGAMENWGLMTFRESMFFWGSDSDKRVEDVVKNVVAHEIAHQWFGNLVTMNWWDEIWLNEGFATVMEYFGRLADSKSEEDAALAFLDEDREATMNKDDSYPARPIVRDLSARDPYDFNRYPRKPSEINDMFDHLAYGKAGLGIFATHAAIDKVAFSEKIQAYLNKFAYETTHSEDVWSGKTKHKPIDFAFKAFSDHLRLPGYPLIIVGQVENGTGEGDQVYEITQKRFYRSSRFTEHPYDRIDSNWTMAVSMHIRADDADHDSHFYLKPEEKKPLRWHLPTIPILNHDGTAYARVVYKGLMNEALQEIVDDGLPKISRIIFYSDLFRVAEIGEVDYQVVMDITFERLRAGVETCDECHESLRDHFTNLLHRLVPGSTKEELTILGGLVDHMLGGHRALLNRPKTAGFRDLSSADAGAGLEELLSEVKRSDDYKQARGLEKLLDLKEEIRSALGETSPSDPKVLKLKTILASCQELELSKCTNNISPSDRLRKLYVPALSDDTKNQVTEKMWQKLEIETDIEEAQRLAIALAVSKYGDYAERILRSLIDQTGLVRLQSAYVVTRYFSDHQKSDRAINFLQQNAQAIYDGLKSSWGQMETLYAGLTARIKDEAQKKIVEQVRQSLPEEVSSLPLWDKSLEAYDIEKEWRKKHRAYIFEILGKKSSEEEDVTPAN